MIPDNKKRITITLNNRDLDRLDKLQEKYNIHGHKSKSEIIKILIKEIYNLH